MTCQEQLAVLLGWEREDPDLLNLHFYIVASFYLQHPAQFTDEALTELRSTFVAAFDGSAPLATLRRTVGARFQGSKRVLKERDARQPVLREWTVTISDVVGGGRPEGASYRVRRWASALRSEL
jgi:hypothetical protein